MVVRESSLNVENCIVLSRVKVHSLGGKCKVWRYANHLIG
jgi:hypothetical protein